ncbi:hypothetical protein F0562_032242 [Nyssa sinensis]|uniref:Uncharacterized protein n=1 Tax=Nyssa sinensis TaxID=561372 RepID=A0A5J5AS46_9ASTE|nr:hypothetical protein F0562_032242 [Nyssa sinensis]
MGDGNWRGIATVGSGAVVAVGVTAGLKVYDMHGVWDQINGVRGGKNCEIQGLGCCCDIDRQFASVRFRGLGAIALGTGIALDHVPVERLLVFRNSQDQFH